MTNAEYKEQAIQLLNSGDENLARMVYAFIKAYQDETPAFGTPLKEEQLIARAEASEADIKAGRTTSKEDLKAEMANW